MWSMGTAASCWGGWFWWHHEEGWWALSRNPESIPHDISKKANNLLQMSLLSLSKHPWLYENGLKPVLKNESIEWPSQSPDPNWKRLSEQRGRQSWLSFASSVSSNDQKSGKVSWEVCGRLIQVFEFPKFKQSPNTSLLTHWKSNTVNKSVSVLLFGDGICGNWIWMPLVLVCKRLTFSLNFPLNRSRIRVCHAPLRVIPCQKPGSCLLLPTKWAF